MNLQNALNLFLACYVCFRLDREQIMICMVFWSSLLRLILIKFCFAIKVVADGATERGFGRIGTEQYFSLSLRTITN